VHHLQVDMIRPRFSIRIVFFVITAVAVGMAVFVVPGIERRRTIRRLESLGVDFIYNEEEGDGFTPDRVGIGGDASFAKPVKAIFRRPCTDHATAFRLIPQLPSIYSVSIGQRGNNAPTFDTPLGPDDFLKLETLTNLYLLEAYAPIGDEGAIAISKLRGLENLTLFHSNVSDRGVTSLVSLNRLKALVLVDGPLISDASLQQIVRLKELRWLALSNTSVAFHIALNKNDLPSLRSLVLENTNVDDEGVDNLVGLQNVWHVNLRHTAITSHALIALSQLPKIEQLILDGTGVTDDYLSNFQSSTTLRYVDLSHTLIDDRGLAAVSKCKSLEELDLDGTKITDTGLAALANLPHLSALSIQNTPISDRGLKAFDSVPSLMVINAQGTQITQAGVAAAAAYNSDRQVEVSNSTGTSVP
jgi:Leucine Rich repeat